MIASHSFPEDPSSIPVDRSQSSRKQPPPEFMEGPYGSTQSQQIPQSEKDQATSSHTPMMNKQIPLSSSATHHTAKEKTKTRTQ